MHTCALKVESLVHVICYYVHVAWAVTGLGSPNFPGLMNNLPGGTSVPASSVGSSDRLTYAIYGGLAGASVRVPIIFTVFFLF